MKTLRERIPSLLWPACMGAMLSVGIVLPALYALSLQAAGTAVFACLFTAMVCVAVSEGDSGHPYIAKIAGALVLFLFCALTGVFGRLGEIAHMLFSMLGGDSEPAQDYAGTIAILFGVFVSICAYNISRQGAGFFPAVSLVLVVFLLVWFSGKREGNWLFIPALVSVCALFAKMADENTSNQNALLAAVVTVAFAFLITSALSFSCEPLEKFANTLRSYLTDTFLSPEERNVYSLEVDGYMPLTQMSADGTKRLGGPVDVTDRPVMTVETPHKLYLRGTIHDHYDGLKWEKTLSTGRYRYSDPRNWNLRADVLDKNQPSDNLRVPSLFAMEQVHVTMQSTSASSLFLPLRFEDLKTQMDSIFYFGVSSEMHIERDLEVGDMYSFAAPNINPYDSDLPEVLAYAAMEGDKRDMSVYLQLPDVISEEICVLTHNVIVGKISPIEKARAIQNHLLYSYKYTLEPETPPRYDFVSYFLLHSREGYCTYFASAMAVMGRIAGLPTRYVEGYVAHPSGGIALVSSKNAHAWAEVYFDGFGWVTFDATPGDGGGNGRSPDENAPDGTENEDQEQGDSQSEENQENESGPEGEDGQSGQNDDRQENSGQNGQDNQGGQESQDSQAPDDPEQNLPAEQGESRKKSSNWWKWLLAFLLLAAVLVRWFWTRMETIIFMHCRNDKERLLSWYKGMLCLFAIAGNRIKPCETPVAFAIRAETFLTENNAARFQAVSDAVTHAGYGRFGAGAAQIIEAKSCYQMIWRKIPFRAKVVWFVTRMRGGIGNVRQVP